MAHRSIQPDGPINPDPLGQLTDQLAAIVGAMLPPDKQDLAEQLARVLSTWAAEVIGRAASQSASVSVTALRRIEALHTEVEQLKSRQVGDGTAE